MTASAAVDRRLDECLSIRGGRLFVEGSDAVELAQRFGTPLYVISEDQLRRNARRFVRAFGERWPEGPVRILPSIKANFTLALRRILTEEGLGCDTFGPGELEAALRCGVPPGEISLNGAVKDRALLERAVEVGARVTLDSAAELDLVRDVARRAGRQARVRFRVRLDLASLQTSSDFYEELIPIGTATQLYKPGIPTEVLIPAGVEALAAPELDVTGVMVHIGRHGADPLIWGGMVRALVGLLAKLREAWDGWEPKEIDVGGGFPVPRDPTGRGLERRRDAADAPSVERYAEVVTETLRSELEGVGIEAAGKTLEVEPGRSLYGDAGIHLTTVRHVKEQRSPIPLTWIEVDTSEIFLADVVFEHNRWTPIVAARADDPPELTAEIVGLSCNFDVIVPGARLPRVESGDVLAFLDTGAYQDASASNFNALPRPGTVLVTGDAAEIVKRAESVDDVFGRDVVPARLEVSRRP